MVHKLFDYSFHAHSYFEHTLKQNKFSCNGIQYKSLPKIGKGIIMATLAYGTDSQRFTGMKDEDVVSELVRDVAMFFNKTKEYIKDKLDDHVIKRWGTDPYQLGGFAFIHAHQVQLMEADFLVMKLKMRNSKQNNSRKELKRFWHFFVTRHNGQQSYLTNKTMRC